MSVPPPKIDPRSYKDIVAQTEALVQKFTDWQPRSDGRPDAGKALIRIFSRMAATISDRINQIPEKSFLSFLDLIGTQIAPPQPARVPLTFSLVDNSPEDAFVPAGTQVAAPGGEDQEEVVFELEDELIVMRSQLTAVYNRQPERDSYNDHTAAALGQTNQDYPAFIATQPIPHHLYLACDQLFTKPGEKTATIKIDSDQASVLKMLPITWSYWDKEATAWKTLFGIVEGLTVTPDPQLSVIKIAPGKALLPGGDGVELATEQTIDLVVTGGPDYSGKTVAILLKNPGSTTVVPIEEATEQELQNSLCLAILQVGAGNLGTVRFALPAQPKSGGSRSWEVVIQKLPALKSHTINGQTAAWLQTRLDMPLWGDRVNIPTIQSITAITEIKDDPTKPKDLVPDACVFNAVPIDIEKDFYPFGEQPRFNDIFYIASKEAFVASQEVTINVKIRGSQANQNESEKVTLAWEYWDGFKWQLIGKSIISKPEPEETVKGNTSSTNQDKFSDSTEAFTKQVDGDVKFSVPLDIADKTINGEENYWIRARIVAGNYGEPASFIPGNPTPTFKRDTFKPPLIESLTINYTLGKTPPVAVKCLTYNDFTYSEQTGTFQPFKLTEDQNPALYLGCDRALPNRPITLYPQVQPLQPGKLTERTTRLAAAATSNSPQRLQVQQVRGFQIGQAIRIAPGSGLQEDHEIVTIQATNNASSSGEMTLKASLKYPQAEGTRVERIASSPRLVWEYYSSDSAHPWQSLGAIDETNGLTEPGLVRFMGPTDMVPCEEFGQRLYWLRLRWERGEFLVPPRLRRILPNTTWATQSVRLDNEVLGSSTGNPDQRFFTSQYPVLPRQRLEVRETLSPAEREALAATDPHGLTLLHNDLGELSESWVCWQEVPDFYGSAQGDRHYVLDHLTGEVRFGDGQRGRVPPLGRQNIRLTSYRTGGGKQGNQPAETITQLKTTIPYIDGATNLEAASGAAEQESLERVKERGPKQLRHRDRAVTAQDIEDLALEASFEVARAKTIPPKFDDELEWLPTYHLAIDRPGTLEITNLTWMEPLPNLQVAIYAPGEANPQFQQAVEKNQLLTYSITAQMLADPALAASTWRVTVSNPHSRDVSSGAGMIVYRESGAISPTASKSVRFDRLTSRPHSQVVDAGRLDLVIVPRSIAQQPTPNLALLDRVERYLQARCAPTLALNVTEPEWVEVTITATLVPLSLQGADAVRERAIRTLTQFLHPLTGGVGGRGWEFGRRPQDSDIYAVLKAVEGVDYVTPTLLVRAGRQDSQDLIQLRTQNSARELGQHFLIYSGNHNLQLALSHLSPG